MNDKPLSRQELIDIRDGNKRNADIRALLLEIKRQHRVLMIVESHLETIENAWKEEVGDRFAAIHRLRALLQSEKGRFADE